jgi:hypothetical protein
MDFFEGRISASAFSSGERLVIGDWHHSPLGKFTNIMWARPDGKRILISPSTKCADYVSKIYSFEEVIVTPLKIKRDKKKIEIKTEDLLIYLEWSWSLHIPIKRPRWFISSVEYFFANLLFGTKTYGKTNDNRKEWYMIKSISWIKNASFRYRNESFGKLTKLSEPIGFGFSDPPTRPSSVRVISMIEKTRFHE